MFTTAFFLALLNSVKGYLVSKGVDLAIKASPWVLLLVNFGIEWLTDTVWGKVRLVTVAVATAVLVLEMVGFKLDVAVPTKKS